MDSYSFAVGFFAGLVLAFVIGWLWLMVSGWRKQRSAFRKPQVVVHTTAKTPAQVRSESFWATVKIILFLAAAFFVVLFVLNRLFPEQVESVAMFFQRLWTMIFG